MCIILLEKWVVPLKSFNIIRHSRPMNLLWIWILFPSISKKLGNRNLWRKMGFRFFFLQVGQIGSWGEKWGLCFERFVNCPRGFVWCCNSHLSQPWRILCPYPLPLLGVVWKGQLQGQDTRIHSNFLMNKGNRQPDSWRRDTNVSPFLEL